MPALRVSEPSDDTIDQRRRRMQERKRDRRGLLAANTAVLDEFEPAIGDQATTEQTAELLGVTPYSATLRNVLNRHRDELIADGWDQAKGTFTRRAIIRLALIMRSDKAKAIAEAAGARYRVISFSAGEKLRHVRRCQAVMDQALEVAERVKDDDPAEVWAALNGLDRYTLQAVAVALGAMVPLDQPGTLQWLSALPSRYARHSDQSLAASGLALIVPTPETADGVPLSQAEDTAETDEGFEL
ncbi:hypothetical protein SEA_NERGAL_47 [Mycobacterium Phage Nergal]|nr:hypothetical protein SEA_NERGAL_47 [Mycobacterium Phage Nergal]